MEAGLRRARRAAREEVQCRKRLRQCRAAQRPPGPRTRTPTISPFGPMTSCTRSPEGPVACGTIVVLPRCCGGAMSRKPRARKELDTSPPGGIGARGAATGPPLQVIFRQSRCTAPVRTGLCGGGGGGGEANGPPGAPARPQLREDCASLAGAYSNRASARAAQPPANIRLAIASLLPPASEFR
jgi:hypothetical protein